LVAENVRRVDLKDIYCFVGAKFGFARVDVINGQSGQVYFSDWLSSTDKQWVHWKAKPDDTWSDAIDVVLTLFSDQAGAPGLHPERLSSVFIASDTELDDAMLRKYQEFVAFHENPIRSADRFGVFDYYVQIPTDVEIRVARSLPSSNPIYTKKQRDVPAGRQSERWDLQGLSLQKGDYSARFRFGLDNQTPSQPDYVLLVHVE
jgi:hypothetical protein